MINKEAYCSFEVAKLLKEKGFNWDCITYYVDSEHDNVKYSMLFENNTTWEERCYSAPTHQMAMKWLREVHNLFIEPRVGETNGKTWYDFDIIPINGRKITWNHYNNLPFVECNSHEEAVEVALKYVLENLI